MLCPTFGPNATLPPLLDGGPGDDLRAARRGRISRVHSIGSVFTVAGVREKPWCCVADVGHSGDAYLGIASVGSENSS